MAFKRDHIHIGLEESGGLTLAENVSFLPRAFWGPQEVRELMAEK